MSHQGDPFEGINDLQCGENMNSRSEMRRLAVQNPDALVEEIERLRAEKESAVVFYTTRLERLKDLLKERGLWETEFAAIFANGTASPFENPTYGQQMNILRHQRDALGADNARLRADFAAMTERAAINGRLARAAQDDNAGLRTELADLRKELDEAPVVYGPGRYDGVPSIWTDDIDEDDTHRARLVRIEELRKP